MLCDFLRTCGRNYIRKYSLEFTHTEEEVWLAGRVLSSDLKVNAYDCLEADTADLMIYYIHMPSHLKNMPRALWN